MEEKIELKIIALTDTISSNKTYAVILEEVIETNARRLPIVIGACDAQHLAVAVEKMSRDSPLTHETFVNFIVKSGHKIKEIVIAELKDGVFSSTIYFENKEQEQYELASRVSDALTLATRLSVPIFTTSKILDEVGIIIGEDNTDVPVKSIEPEVKASFWERAKKLFGA